MSRDTDLDGLVQRADLDGLVRHVDDVCAAREWEHLLHVRDRARAAVDTGRQLWPIATLANHRLALWAPAPLAVRALDDSARTFMPGPVSEILAVHHTWEELSPHVPAGHDRSLLAHERSLRGDAVPTGEPSLIDIPISLQSWEPDYVPAIYTDDGVEALAPRIPAPHLHIGARTGEPLDDPETVAAFRMMTEPWTRQSNGSARCVVAEGGMEEALHALGVDECRGVEINHGQALEVLAWAAADGGAHGRRRGLATGRSNAWWFLAVFTGLHDSWPCDPDEFGDVLAGLSWWLWSPTHGDAPGWNVHLVVVDNDEGLSCGVVAHDHL